MTPCQCLPPDFSGAACCSIRSRMRKCCALVGRAARGVAGRWQQLLRHQQQPRAWHQLVVSNRLMSTGGGATPIPPPKLGAALVGPAVRRADAVCFDVDSTVITTEGIDELGAWLGKAEEVCCLLVVLATLGGSVGLRGKAFCRPVAVSMACPPLQLRAVDPKLRPPRALP